MTDYPGAEEHFVPRNFMFNSNSHSAIVLHKTGGDATPEAIYTTFLASGNPGHSVHYGIGSDGTIWQYVPEALGAGGNGVVEAGYDPFWQPYLDQYGNLNLCTLSIEHTDASLTNSTPLTSAQQAASFKLVAYLVQKYAIPLSHIKGHFSLDPIDRGNCPGNYPWAELFSFLENGGEPMDIDITTPGISSYYTQDALGRWVLTSNPALFIMGDILKYYKHGSHSGSLGGLTDLGLPTSLEQLVTVNGKELVIPRRQTFERGDVLFDPNGEVDAPPGHTGTCYMAHIDQAVPPPPSPIVDPRIVLWEGLLTQINALSKI